MTTQYNRQTAATVDAIMKLKEVLGARAKVDDLKMVMRHLFACNASVETDNQGQLVVYTGYTCGAHTGDVMTMQNEPEGFPQFWCKND